MLIRGDGKFIIPVKIIKSSELGIVENQKNIFLKNDIKDRLRALATEISNGNRQKIPGCPANPQWVIETLGYLAVAGNINLDSDGRPTAYYGELIHDRCPRRRFFDAGVFAEKYGDEECMFLLGCRGPVTYAYCPVSRWNNSDNWPIGDNTTCIGCAAAGFPDKMQPFANYGGRI